jgi:serine protease AprX
MPKLAQIFVDKGDKDRCEEAKRETRRILAEYDTYLVAEVDEVHIANLDQKGFVVQERPEFRKIEVGNVEFEAEENRESLGLASFAGDDEFYVLQFVGPEKDKWIEALEKLGATFRYYVPNNAYVVRMRFHTIHQVTSIRNMMFVRFITRYIPEFRISSRLKGRKGMLPLAEFKVLRLVPDAVPYDRRGNITVMLHDPAYMSEATHNIKELGGTIVDSARDFIIIAVDPSSGAIEKTAENKCIKWIEPYKPPELCINRAALIINAPTIWNPRGLNGAGQIVAVADTGIDAGHPDFQGPNKILRITALGRIGDATDAPLPLPPPPPPAPGPPRNRGHGTHVAGIILGTGARSVARALGFQIRGIAHGASLVFQSVMDAGGGLGGFPADLYQLFLPPYDDRARIHNNSWGAPQNGAYDVRARAVDEFVWDHRDMVIVIAAGNEGTDATAPHGRVDSDSLTTPGTAKNCITVGGSENERPTINTRWGAYHHGPPGRIMNHPPISNDRVANNGEGMMAISGRGPADAPHEQDRRTKPDLVAPGSCILSTKAAPIPVAWAAGSPDPNFYMFKTGTSMATPMVSGAAAIVRQYLLLLKPRRGRTIQRKTWRKQATNALLCGGLLGCHQPPNARGNISPTAALIKAFLIHGAVRIKGHAYPKHLNDAEDHSPSSQGRIPNNSQGFGRLDLEQSLFPSPRPAMEIFDGHTLAQDERRQYQFLVSGRAVPFKATLVWTDAPDIAMTGRLVNDLTLVAHTPNKREFHGNFTNAQPAGKNFDHKNNVEKIIIQRPLKGIYRIDVKGDTIRAINHIPGGNGQDYALIVSADITATLRAVQRRAGEYPPTHPGWLPAPKLCNKAKPFDPPHMRGDGPLVVNDHRRQLVTHLQKMLVAIGFEIGETGPNYDGVDGIFGPRTKKAVDSFQSSQTDWERQKLKVDSKVGPRTADALNRAMVGVWYDLYETPLELTKGTRERITVTNHGVKKGLVSGALSSARTPILSIRFVPDIRILLLNPSGNRFSFQGEGNFKVLDNNDNTILQGKIKKEDDIQIKNVIATPFTVELDIDSTFYTFYGEV